MSAGEDVSIAPPGWVAPARGVTVPAAPQVPAAAAYGPTVGARGGQSATEAALRWRLRAASLDSIVASLLYGVLCAALHWSPVTPSHWLAFLAIEIVYHTAMEAQGGQTLGKRRYGVRVVAVDGSSASLQAVFLRSVLRPIDRLPAWYASGLISLVRTGPSRRQRIGDVAGGTIVVAEAGRSAARGTPSWMLPAALLASVAISLLFVYRITESGTEPLSSGEAAAWVSNCNQGAGALVDCSCVLTRLQGAGYTSYRALLGLETAAERERMTATRGPELSTLQSAFLDCRR